MDLRANIEQQRRLANEIQGEEWCDTNECERSSCHRCYPRRNCTSHTKCVEFTASGEAYTEDEAQRL